MGKTKGKVTLALILDVIIRILDIIRCKIKGSSKETEYRQDTQENRETADKLKDYIKDHTIN